MQNLVEGTVKGDIYKRSRILYIIEAAVEYFSSILVSGAFLATLTTSLGMSDSMTGVLTALTSLGFCFQILSILMSGVSSVKKLTIFGTLFKQALFVVLYALPFFDISSNAKSVLIIVFMLGAHMIGNIVYSPKIAWLMGLVDDRERGKFTAVKEMVSLLSGMIFTLVMGRIVDYFEENGNINGAFITCTITLFVISLVHLITLFCIKEKPKSEAEIRTDTVKKQLVSIIKCKNFWRIVPVLMLWSIAHYASSPFYGTYLISELAFTLTATSVISIVSSIARTVFSLPIGSFADKHGFSNTLIICLSIMTVAFGAMIFATPQSKYLYIVYSILFYIGMAGLNSSEINLVLDHTSRELRAGALAIKGLICGLTGFLTTLFLRPLVDYVQANGNKIFGIDMYAQQLTSIISTAVCIIALIYLVFITRKLKKK